MFESIALLFAKFFLVKGFHSLLEIINRNHIGAT